MYRYILTVLTTLCLAGCDELFPSAEDFGDLDQIMTEVAPRQRQTMRVDSVTFSPNYKTFDITTTIINDIGPYLLADTSRVRVEVSETINGIEHTKRSTPRLVNIRNTEAEAVTEYDIRVLVLVDLSLPQHTLNTIRDKVINLKSVFNGPQNLYVAFMSGKTVTESMPTSPYVMDNYFKHADENYVYLYRSILQKKYEMISDNEPWKDCKHAVLITFSDGKLYADGSDEPLDPDHYLLQEELVKKNDQKTNHFLAFYADCSKAENRADDYSSNVLWVFCNNNGGSYMDQFQLTTLEAKVFEEFGVKSPSNIFRFVNPNFKVYRGSQYKLTVEFHDTKTDSVFSSFTTNIVKGSIFAPIIVNGNSLPVVLLQGIVLCLIIILLVWLVLQLLVPYIRYKMFYKKHVTTYTGNNMSWANHTVKESCYYCKAPFEVGDKIVVKCEHTMHKSCWDENGYHCPEYSDHCKHGSHYYNTRNLYDPHNASFYMNWVIMAILAALEAWFCFTLIASLNGRIALLPSFGLTVSFFMTLAISTLAIIKHNFSRIFIYTLTRSVIASIGSFILFYVVEVIIESFGLQEYQSYFSWIPWTLMGFLIAVCSTYGTRIPLRKSLIGLSAIIGFLSMYVWSIIFFDSEIDFRVLLLFSFLVFAVGLSLCIARTAPRSDRYFLKVEGAVKTMDVALYKWFRNNPKRIVTIGKSVDCSLQLSWDMMGNVSPVHAEIHMDEGGLYLLALEKGVYVEGHELKLNTKEWLYHGKMFNIGNTTFTYIEKDR
jgi:hypothetical protein